MIYFSDQPSSLWEALEPTHGHLIDGTEAAAGTQSNKHHLDFILPSLPSVPLKVAVEVEPHDQSDAHSIFASPLDGMRYKWTEKQQKAPSAVER